MLVGVHFELCSEEKINENLVLIHEKLPKYKYPNLHQIITVCKSGPRGIKELKEFLYNEAEKLSFEFNKIPPTWVNFSSLIKDFIAFEKVILSWNECKAWGHLCNIQEHDFPSLIPLLHYSGFFHSIFLETSCSRLIVLRPQWLILIGHHILKIETNNGIVPLSNLNLSNLIYQNDIYDVVFEYFKENKILYTVQLKKKQENKEEIALISNCITTTRPTACIIKYFPNEMSASHNVFCRILQFSNIPFGVLYHFLLILYQNDEISLEYWNYGILIHFPIHKIVCCIEQNDEQCEIQIYMRFLKLKQSRASQIWEYLLFSFKNQIEIYHPSLLYSMEEMIPCSHCQKRKKFWRKGFLFTLQECYQSFLKNFRYVYCQHIESQTRAVNIFELIPELDVSTLPQIENHADHFQGNELIGEGSYGKILKGTFCGKDVAVKQMKCNVDDLHSLSTPEIQEFLFEAKMMNRLNHPNIVKIYGFTVQPLQMIIQFLNGGDLFQFLHPPNPINGELTNLNSASFPWNQRFSIAFSLAKGLHYLQTLNPPIVHRDLRSPNIFVSNKTNS